MKSVVALNYTKYVPSHWEGVVSRPDLTTSDGGNKLQLQTLLTFYNRLGLNELQCKTSGTLRLDEGENKFAFKSN